MKIKTLAYCLLLAGFVGTASAQEWETAWHEGGIRHVKGVSLFGASYGRSKASSTFSANYSQYLTSKWIWNVRAIYENGQYDLTHLNGYYTYSGFDRTLFKIKDFAFFNAGLAAYLGAEGLSSSELNESKNSFIFGVAGNLNIEFYLFNSLLLQVQAEQYYSPISKLGKFFPVYSVGLKYCFY